VRLSIVVLLVFAAACAPQLEGTCTQDIDCKRADEYCSGGICLRRGASGSVSVEMTSPAAGSQLSRAFHVAAHLAGDGAISDVTFLVANSANGAALGQVAVNAGTAGTWAGTVTLDAAAFGGPANVRAVAHRTGLPDVVSSPVPVVIDQNAPAVAPAWGEEWYARDAGISVAVLAADDRSGVASAELQLPDGGTYSAAINGSTAVFQLPASDLGPPGAVAVVPVQLSATDVAGNRASVDGGTLRVDDEPPTVGLTPLSTTAWFGTGLDVAATAGDGAGSGVASALLLVDGKPAPAGTRNGGDFTFHAELAQMVPGREGHVTVQVVATDAVGNSGSASQSIQVDTIAPMISAAQVDTAADGRDAAGQDWFLGPTNVPGAPDIVVSASIADLNLVPDPVAVVGTTRYPGTEAGGRWTFAIPRAVGRNAQGPIVVTFDAEDLAGNHPVASPSVALYFDDVGASSFKPSVVPDPAWYGRNDAVRPPIAVTLPALPRSGISSVILRPAGQMMQDSDCEKVGPAGYQCRIASTFAPSGVETALAFQVIATSVAGVVSTSSGSCNIDDAPPVISTAAAIPYPAPAGALSWSHDGAHFNVRDNAVLYRFKAHDCGSGVRSVTAFSLSPQPATRAVSLADSGSRQSCANGTVAVIYDVSVSADLATLPAGTFPAADNVLNLSVTVADGPGDGASGLVPHGASQTKAVAVTRRLWQTGAQGMSRLALGPWLVASSGATVAALDPRDGHTVWNNPGNVLGSPVVGGSAAAPVVYYATGPSTESGSTLKQVSAGNGAAVAGDCLVLANAATSCRGGFVTHSASLALATDGTPVVADNYFLDLATNGEFDCWNAAVTVWHGCSSWIANTANLNLDGPFVGRAGHVFFIHKPISPSAGPQQGVLRESDLVAGGKILGPECSSIDLLTDAGGADAPACNGQRHSFDGSGFSPFWPGASVSPARTLPPLDLFFAADGNAHSLATGSSIPGFNGAGAPLLIDGSSSPVLFSGGGATLSALHISASGYGATALGLPPVSGPIDDTLLDRSGTLYVASNGQVSAIATSSPGPAGGTAWPTRGRDNCRSNNLEFACPY